MICNNTKELLSEIKKYMDLNDIQMKDLSITLGKSPQSISQIFKNGNPNCNTIFEICKALDVDFDINLLNKLNK